jgi:hypothetical protein
MVVPSTVALSSAAGQGTFDLSGGGLPLAGEG